MTFVSLFLLLILQYVEVYSSIYYVVPEYDVDQCSSLNQTCHDLFFYSKNSELFFTDAAVFYFLPGKHHLNTTILVTAVENLTLQGLGEQEVGFHETIMQTTVKIECENANGGLVFLDVLDLTLSGLTFTECNSLPLTMVESQDLLLFFEYLVEVGTPLQEIGVFNASVFLLQVSNVKIKNISIQNATQIGLLGINVFNSTMESSSFSVNNFESVVDCVLNNGFCEGGNLIIGYTYSWPNVCYGINTVFTLGIKDSNFSFGFSTYVNDAIPGGGVSLCIDNYSRYSVRVSMTNVHAYNNTALPGGNINIVTSKSSSFYSFYLERISSKFGDEVFQTLHQLTKPDQALLNLGGGSYISIGTTFQPSLQLIGDCSVNVLELPEYPVTINSSSFTENTALIGGGLYTSVESFQRSSRLQYILLLSSDFSSNNGYVGVGLYIGQKSFQTFAAALEYDVIDINVTNSRIKVPPNITTNGTSIYMDGLHRVNILNILVSDNDPAQGALLSSTNLIITGLHNIFRNNSALSGGAISMLGGSLIFLVPPAKIYFIKNRATIDGGALYVNDGPILRPYCFFQIQSTNDTLHPIAEWHFINNTAGFSGNDIYGAEIDKCYLFESSNVAIQNSSYSIFLNTFFLESPPAGKSDISSDPNRVCICSNDSLKCNLTQLNIQAIPGDYIVLSLATVGILESFSKGIIRIQEFLVVNHTITNILTRNIPFFDAVACSNYAYEIASNGSDLLLSLSVSPPVVNPVDSLVSFPSIHISISVLPCPPGFFLSSNYCVCNEALTQISESNITCNISNQHLTRNGDVWIGYHNSSDCLFVQARCPLNYIVAPSTNHFQCIFLMHNVLSTDLEYFVDNVLKDLVSCSVRTNVENALTTIWLSSLCLL